MLRASACHNYSPEPPDSAPVPAEPVVQASDLAERWPTRREIVSTEAKAVISPLLETLSARRPPHPPTGDPTCERPLDSGTGLTMEGPCTAQPPPLRGTARAALLTRITLA
ncbi:hypothetical protein GCM10023086_13670 [Streptomyces venetus]|uniref:Uncharacterized protein n=1 Tax=Streptomyces venetus TaxID=1701086 RepID=A0ABP8FAM6_9ACTN